MSKMWWALCRNSESASFCDCISMPNVVSEMFGSRNAINACLVLFLGKSKIPYRKSYPWHMIERSAAIGMSQFQRVPVIVWWRFLDSCWILGKMTWPHYSEMMDSNSSDGIAIHQLQFFEHPSIRYVSQGREEEDFDHKRVDSIHNCHVHSRKLTF